MLSGPSEFPRIRFVRSWFFPCFQTTNTCKLRLRDPLLDKGDSEIEQVVI
jgi:hypothetical protein